MIRSYELSVLLVPQLEEAYQAHPHRGFLCAPVSGQEAAVFAAGLRIPPPGETPVEFWSLGSAPGGGHASPELQGPRCVFIPLPFELPPPRYSSADQPWTNDTLYDGKDAIGREVGQPGWSLYGLSEGPEE